MGLNNPSPCLTGLNSGYHALCDAEVCGDCGMNARVATDQSHSILVQFAVRVFSPFVCSAKFYSILHVSGPGVPSKIANVIVCSIAVFVAAIKFLWHGLVKRTEYKPVNGLLSAKRFSYCKSDIEVTMLGRPWLKKLPFNPLWASAEVFYNSVFASDIAKIGRGIRSFKPWYWFPNFHNGTPFESLIMPQERGLS